MIPSVVGIDENGDIIVGELAKERRMRNSGETASNFKRKMGTSARIKIKDRVFDAQMLSSISEIVEVFATYLDGYFMVIVKTSYSISNCERRSSAVRFHMP